MSVEVTKIPMKPTLRFTRRHVLERMIRVWREQKAQLSNLKLPKQAKRVQGLIDSAGAVLSRLEE